MVEKLESAGEFVAAVMRRVQGVEVARRSRPGGGEAGRAVRREGFDLVSVRTGRLDADGELEFKTTPGYLTERRRAPSVLAKLPADHPDLLVARQYAALSEMVGAIRGTDLLSSGGGGISDGGAASRTDEAGMLRVLQEAIGVGLALRANGQRAIEVTDRQVVDALILEEASIDTVLRRSGRRAQSSRSIAKVRASLVASLDRMATVLGYKTG